MSAAQHRPRRWPLFLLLTLLLLAALAMAGVFWGARLLKTQVEAALGPEAEVGAIQLHWNSVEVQQLRLRAAVGWPAVDTLRAERIVVSPDLRGLLTDRQIRISRISVDGAYLSALRTPEGRMRVIPSLLERKRASGNGEALPVTIGKVVLNDAVLEFFDASIRKPPLKIRIDQLQATVSDIHLPDLKGQSAIFLAGRIRGEQQDGSLSLEGSLEVASRESHLVTRLRGVDLVALSPYLVKTAESGVKKGNLDLDVESTVHDNQLHAPGTVTLNALELDDSGGFMGVTRRGALSMMKDHQQQISVKFELNGNLNDPKFKLNESLAARFGAGLADTLGLSLSGIAEGAASIGQKSVEAVGGAFRKLFGDTKPKDAPPPSTNTRSSP
ncbi:MAG: DUF748 domain-containing protein [Rhodocyclaceae bacterium]|nr:MAG: DUF748 domain-containing protein [Rhodocyclaceae bacterium]